jgi:hypothetical protein
MRAPPLFTQRNFWICAPRDLKDIATRLGTAFGLTDADFSTEDDEEWVEGFAKDGVSFYVCRQGGLDAPVRFIIKPFLPDPTEFGRRLASCLGERVFYGEVTYLGDEKFRYSEICRYEHEAA